MTFFNARVTPDHHGRSFDVLIRAGAGAISMTVSGELDAYAVAAFDRHLSVVAATEHAFSIDGDGLTFIDRAGVDALLRAAELGATFNGLESQLGPIFTVVGGPEDPQRPVTPRRRPASWQGDPSVRSLQATGR